MLSLNCISLVLYCVAVLRDFILLLSVFQSGRAILYQSQLYSFYSIFIVEAAFEVSLHIKDGL